MRLQLEEDHFNQMLEVEEVMDMLISVMAYGKDSDQLQIQAGSLAGTLTMLHRQLKQVRTSIKSS